MAYIGRTTDGFGVRQRFLFTPDAGATSVSGTDANGATLTFSDSVYMDVFLNGVLLKAGTDYNTNTANTIAGLTATVANDEVTVLVYDIFTTADMVSATSGGTFSGNVTHSGTVTVDDTTDSSSTTTGSIQTDGGVGIAKKLYVGTDLDVDGTANLDVVDIDGAVDIDSTLTVSNDLTVGGTDFFVDTSADKVGIGTNTANELHQKLTIYSSAEAGIQFQNNDTGVTNSTDGCRISVFEDDIQYTNYETSGKHIFNGGSGTATRLEIEADGDVNVKTGNLVIGTSGKGIDFSAGAGGGSSSNLLDEYEEGTFTFGTNANVAFVSNSNVGKYVKIGKMVHLQLQVDVSSVSGTNHFYLSGMPFAQDANTTNTLNGYSQSAVRFYNFDTYYAGSQVTANMENQSSNMYFYESYDSVNTLIASNTRATSTTEIFVSHTYFTDS